MEGEGAENAAGFLDFEALHFFKGGMDAGWPAALIGGAAFVLVDGDDSVFADEVIDVFLEEMLGVEGVIEGGEQAVGSVVNLIDLQDVFGAGEAFVSDFDVLVSCVENVVDSMTERAGGGAGTTAQAFA